MNRFLTLLILGLLAGCVSPTEQKNYWDTQRAQLRFDQGRLNDIYCDWFEKGFLEGWAGGGGVIETDGLIGESRDPEGEWAIHRGYMDGQRVASKARLAYEMERLAKEKK